MYYSIVISQCFLLFASDSLGGLVMDCCWLSKDDFSMVNSFSNLLLYGFWAWSEQNDYVLFTDLLPVWLD